MAKSGLSVKPMDLVVIGAVVLVIAGTYAFVLPASQRLQETTAIRKTKQAERDRLQAQVDGLKQLAQSLPQYTREINLLNVAFPPEPQTAEAMIQTQTMAERAGLSVLSLSPSQPKAGSLPVTANVRGSFQALDNFFKELNSNLRPTIIKTMTANSEKDQVSASFTMSYEYNSVGEAAAKPSPVPTSK